MTVVDSMTTVFLENGRSVGIQGDVSVTEGVDTLLTISFLGPVVRVSDPHTMETLDKTRPSSICEDNDLPGTIYFTPYNSKRVRLSYLQIDPLRPVLWRISKEDARVAGW